MKDKQIENVLGQVLFHAKVWVDVLLLTGDGTQDLESCLKLYNSSVYLQTTHLLSGDRGTPLGQGELP